MKSRENLVWMDMEMTGLDPESCHILEIGALITNADLEPLSEALCVTVKQPVHVLQSMDPWCAQQHTRSGLLERVRDRGITLQETEQALLKLLRRFCHKGKSPLCGNSICQDRRFLIKYLPKVDAYLHYRNIDVSSIKELVNRWYPKEVHFRKKRPTHRALNDIYESIDELRYYQARLFSPLPET